MERFGVPKHIVGFVMPTGYSFIWTGQRCTCRSPPFSWRRPRGVEMSFGQQILMMLTLMLTSKGVAGVPRAALVILAGNAGDLRASTGRCGGPARDRCRDGYGPDFGQRAGNCLATAVVARWEGFELGSSGEVSELEIHARREHGQ